MIFFRQGLSLQWIIFVFIIPSHYCFSLNDHSFVVVSRYHLSQLAHGTCQVHSLPRKHTSSPSSRSLAAFFHEANAPFGGEFWKRSVLSGFKSTHLSLVIIACAILSPLPTYAAPPFAVIAEELGYFPVMVPKPGSKTKETILQYVPKRVQRHSTEQAVDLAHFLRTRRDSKVILAGTYWCSHTSRQKELFGLEAWTEMNADANGASTTAASIRPTGFTYLECAPQGYRGNPTMCANLGVDGYPTWIITQAGTPGNSQQNAVRLSGERPLVDIAEAVGYVDGKGHTFDAALEASANPPSSLGAAACKN